MAARLVCWGSGYYHKNGNVSAFEPPLTPWQCTRSGDAAQGAVHDKAQLMLRRVYPGTAPG